MEGFSSTDMCTLLRKVNGVNKARGRALVLMYHRISNEPDYLGLCVAPDIFHRHLICLKQRAQVLPLSELVKHVSSNESLGGDIAAITFDDGYRDNLEVALPILAQHELPATVFVTTDFIDGREQPVGERLQCSFESLWCQGIAPDTWDGIGDYRIDRLVRAALTRPGSSAALRRLAFALPRLQWDHTKALVELLERQAGVSQTASSRILDWKGVSELARRGIEIGSHSVSHAILSRIPRERAEYEMLVSKQRIEKRIGSEVRAFSFPNGSPEDFTDQNVQYLEQLGYTYACTTQRGVNRAGTNPYRICRIGVGNDSERWFDLKLALGR